MSYIKIYYNINCINLIVFILIILLKVSYNKNVVNYN